MWLKTKNVLELYSSTVLWRYELMTSWSYVHDITRFKSVKCIEIIKKAWNKKKICLFYVQDQSIYHSWSPDVTFSLVAATLVKILHLEITREVNFDLTLKQINIVYIMQANHDIFGTYTFFNEILISYDNNYEIFFCHHEIFFYHITKRTGK